MVDGERRLVDHFAQPHVLPAGVEYLTWHVTMDRSTALAAEAERFAEASAGIEGMAAVPPKWLHLTMLGVGPADEVSTDEVDAVAAAVADALESTPALEVSLGPLDVHPGGASLPAWPIEPLDSIRAHVHDGIEAVLGDRVPGGPSFEGPPHVTLGYATADASLRPVEQRLAEMALRAPVDVTIDRVDLIRLRREDARYVWTTMSTVDLEPSRPTGSH